MKFISIPQLAAFLEPAERGALFVRERVPLYIFRSGVRRGPFGGRQGVRPFRGDGLFRFLAG